MVIRCTYGHQYQLEVYDTDMLETSHHHFVLLPPLKQAISLKPNQDRKCIGSSCSPSNTPCFFEMFLNIWQLLDLRIKVIATMC